jgi:hypothetical protein
MRRSDPNPEKCVRPKAEHVDAHDEHFHGDFQKWLIGDLAMVRTLTATYQTMAVMLYLLSSGAEQLY